MLGCSGISFTVIAMPVATIPVLLAHCNLQDTQKYLIRAAQVSIQLLSLYRVPALYSEIMLQNRRRAPDTVNRPKLQTLEASATSP